MKRTYFAVVLWAFVSFAMVGGEVAEAALVHYVVSSAGDGQVKQDDPYPCIFGLPTGSTGNKCKQGTSVFEPVELSGANPVSKSWTGDVGLITAVHGNAFDIAIDINRTGAEPDHILNLFTLSDAGGVLFELTVPQTIALGNGTGSNGADAYLVGFDLTGITGNVTFATTVDFGAGTSAGSDFFYLVAPTGLGPGTSGGTHTPEPGSLVLVGCGLVALGLVSRKRFHGTRS